jgi:MFS family permease
MDKKWWTLLAVCAGMFMLLLDVTIVIVAQPAIQDGLHASLTEVQWVLDAYALTLASLLLTSGVLADRYGRKLLFQIGLVIFTLGSLLCGMAQDPLMLIVSRSGQGVGGAIMFATSLALLGHSFRGRDRDRMELARHLPGQRAGRRPGRRAHRLAGRGIQVAASDAAGLGRVRAADHRVWSAWSTGSSGPARTAGRTLASSSAWPSRPWP